MLTIFGSARVDAFLELPNDKAGQFCKLDTRDCFIQLSYAAKLPLNSVKFLVGGNGANVAVGTKRLGVESLLVAELGEGPLASFAHTELSKEIVMDHVSQTPGLDQGFGAVIVYQGERTILSYYSPERPPFPENLETSDWAYLTSVGENFEDYFEDVFKWLSQNNTKLAFNPGGRQIAKGASWLGKYLEKTEVLLVNREEAEAIVGINKSQGKEKEILDACSSLGIKIPVITDGGEGAFAKMGNTYYKVGVIPIDPFERTGAGDSFSTGFLAALIQQKEVPEALLYGTVNAASVISFVGPEQGLLGSDQIDSWLERAKSSGVKVEEF